MDLEIDLTQRVLHITLNRQSKRNALTMKMCSGIVDAVNGAQSNTAIGCIAIDAVGTVFCAGMDLDEGVRGPELLAVHEELFTIGKTSLKPIVVSVNGPALAGGLGLAAQGHVVLASELAVFGLPEIRIGFWPFVVYRSVAAALGERRTLHLSLTGDTFHAQQGFTWGLVDRICPSPELADRARLLARELAKASPMAIGAGMQYVHEARGKGWDEAGQIAARLRAKLMSSDDFKEGTAAFKGRREPRWPSMLVGFYESHHSSSEHE